MRVTFCQVCEPVNEVEEIVVIKKDSPRQNYLLLDPATLRILLSHTRRNPSSLTTHFAPKRP